MLPVVGVVIIGGILYLLSEDEKDPKKSGDSKDKEKKDFPSERDVTRLRRELKAALKKEKEPTVRTATKPEAKK